MLHIQNHNETFLKLWEESPTHFPAFHRKYTLTEKREREATFAQFQQKIQSLQSKSRIRQFKENPGASFFPMFKGFLETVFDFDKQHLEIILSDDFKEVSKDFFDKARAFGPELSPGNIYQGMRNVWIMNGIQLMLNVPVEITPSVFAYSMIYPYSDNLLDDPEITDTEKQEFSNRFNDRLHGKQVEPFSQTESQLFKLVGLFEQQYNREDFPEVYESLFAIQKAQTDSLKLLNSENICSDEIRRICFEKGGTSVLADGFLVAGKLTEEQQEALYGYGVYLQLLDDIQDVKEDSEASTKTIFSCRKQEEMGAYVNRCIHFGRAALEKMKSFKSSQTDLFLSLMNRSIETMIIESAGVNDNWYSERYLHELELFSPLHFGFVREQKAKSKSHRFSLFQKYFEQKKETPVFSI